MSFELGGSSSKVLVRLRCMNWKPAHLYEDEVAFPTERSAPDFGSIWCL
jgi:hypothetical protein